MDKSLRDEIAELLLALIDRPSDEQEYMQKLIELTDNIADPFAELAQDEAGEYLRSLHRLNVLGRPVAPDPYETASGRETLRLIAQGLSEGWSFKEVEKALRRI